jgi:Glycosyl hydrolases family 2, sugar binding domain
MHHYPHRIRLRGPWECEPLQRIAAPDAAEESLPGPCRMTMPCSWHEGGLVGFAGRVRFTRRFGYPGNIDASERVWLTFAAVEGNAKVWLNDRLLGAHEGAAGSFEHDVTEVLATRNRLVVEVEALTDRGGLWGEVALQIRRTAFLRAVCAWADPMGMLQVSGEVVGTAERPLDLYVLLDGVNVAYITVEAAPTGKPFQVTAVAPDAERLASGYQGPERTHEVRIELVDAATVWYRVEQQVSVG